MHNRITKYLKPTDLEFIFHRNICEGTIIYDVEPQPHCPARDGLPFEPSEPNVRGVGSIKREDQP